MSSRKTAGRVIVVGSSNTDLVVHCDTLPAPGETVLGKDMLTFAGGKGANQAVAAARAGAKVHFIGAFGDDAFGKARRADLEREGIDCSGCVVKKGVPSGVALIGIGRGAGNTKAENLIIVAPGANARLTPADVKRGMPKKLDKNDVVLCSLEIPVESVLLALKLGCGSSGISILNPAPLPKDRHRVHLLQNCNVVTPNEIEAGFLTRFAAASTLEKAMETVLRSPHSRLSHCITTRGSKGAVHFFAAEDSVGVESVSAPKVIPIDTVGAGDCFNGSLAAFLSINGLEFTEGTRYAVAAASLKVTRQGAQAGMPYRHEILKMMKTMK